MQIGGVELVLNRPLLLIGSTDPAVGDLALDARSPTVADGRHVLVAIGPDTGLTHARIWLDEPIGDDAVVFDGILDLPNGLLYVGNDTGLWFLTLTLHRAGPVRVAVTVDNVDNAAIVDVFVEPAPSRSA